MDVAAGVPKSSLGDLLESECVCVSVCVCECVSVCVCVRYLGVWGGGGAFGVGF